MTQLRNCAVARSVGRAFSSRARPSGVMLKRVSVWTPTILPSLTRISKAEYGREKGSVASSTSVISFCPRCKRHGLPSHRMGIDSHTVGMVATVMVGSGGLTVPKNGSLPRFCKSMGGEVHVEGMSGNDNIDLIRTDGGGYRSKISKCDARMLINDLVKPCQFCIRHGQFV